VIVPPLLFIRHGETDWNVEGRLQGQRDVGLNALGRRQASEAGQRLAAFLSRQQRHPADAVFVCSPLERARHTMESVRTALGLDPRTYAIDERLAEVSFGAWEGMTWPEVKAHDPAAHKERRRDKWNFVPPEGESYAMLAERVKAWLATADERLVVVSHGGVARALMVLAGGASRQSAPGIEVQQGRVLHFADRGYAWL
jgi:broad specificity phosphatase PhoE